MMPDEIAFGTAKPDLLNADEAAERAARVHALPFRAGDIETLCILGILLDRSGHGEPVLVSVRDVDLFAVLTGREVLSSKRDLFSELGQDDARRLPREREPAWLALTLGAELHLFVPRTDLRPHRIQLFIRQYRAANPVASEAVGRAQVFEETVSGATFRATSARVLREAIRIWLLIDARVDSASELDRRTTPSIYGVKTRILAFVITILRSVAPENAIVADLMSGSGIVSRKLARTHRVISNDANAYGSAFASALPRDLGPGGLEALMGRLRYRLAENMEAVRSVFEESLRREAELLTSPSTIETMEAYDRFCAQVPSFFGSEDGDRSTTLASDDLRNMVLERRASPTSFPFVLAASYWTNVHFGLRQAVVLDGLRYAVHCEAPDLREPLLAALLHAALICASGPHFAQPFRPRGLSQHRALIEKRSRHVDAEFFASLTSRADAGPPAMPMIDRLRGDWRHAIRRLAEEVGSDGRGVVYADPPYTNVQYSRYYHVLNVLVDYDYPVCEGPGRCPKRGYRFSSRFEYQPGSAKRELAELIDSCSSHGFDVVLSYSRSGAIPLDDLLELMERRFPSVSVFQEPTRHNNQGRAAPRERMETVEYAIVGQLDRVAESSKK